MFTLHRLRFTPRLPPRLSPRLASAPNPSSWPMLDKETVKTVQVLTLSVMAATGMMPMNLDVETTIPPISHQLMSAAPVEVEIADAPMI